MQADREPTVEMSPFPILKWSGFQWDGIVHLPSWCGFIPIEELCPWVSRGIRPDGDLELAVVISSEDINNPTPPTPQQGASFQHILDHQAPLRDAVLQAIFVDYPRLRAIYLEFVDERLMPEISKPSELMRLVRPSCVYILANPKDGFTRVGFGFACSWDEEHGLGVLTHRADIILVGGAEEAFSEYFPELDDETD